MGNLVQPMARPLRVLMVTPRYFPFMGGVETHVYEVGRRLAAAGVDLCVLTTDPASELPAHEMVEGMHIWRVPAYPPKLDLYIAPAIVRVIGAEQWDVVHCQSYHTFVAPLAMAAALRHKVPYIVTFHSGGNSSALRNAVRQTQWRLLRPLFARAARLIGVSQFETAAFRDTLHLAPEQFVVIPNGGKLPAISATTAQPHIGDDKLILAVGRLERYKGHQRVIAAMPTVLQRFPLARLVIVGGGPYESALRQQIADLGLGERVTVCAIPPSDRQAMADMVASANLITLFSDYEAHPIAVMEAIALGKPVLATLTSGLQELAEKGWIQAIRLAATPDEAGAAIIAQLIAPRLPPQVTLPTWEDCADSLLRVYETVVAARAA